MTAYEHGGWKARRRAYKNPPESTEQALHPATKLFPTREHPRKITLPKLEGTELENERDGRAAVVELLPAVEVKAGRGRAGLGRRSLRRREAARMASSSACSSPRGTREDDAKQFFDAYLATLPARFAGADRRRSPQTASRARISARSSSSVTATRSTSSTARRCDAAREGRQRDQDRAAKQVIRRDRRRAARPARRSQLRPRRPATRVRDRGAAHRRRARTRWPLRARARRAPLAEREHARDRDAEPERGREPRRRWRRDERARRSSSRIGSPRACRNTAAHRPTSAVARNTPSQCAGATADRRRANERAEHEHEDRGGRQARACSRSIASTTPRSTSAADAKDSSRDPTNAATVNGKPAAVQQRGHEIREQADRPDRSRRPRTASAPRCRATRSRPLPGRRISARRRRRRAGRAGASSPLARAWPEYYTKQVRRMFALGAVEHGRAHEERRRVDIVRVALSPCVPGAFGISSEKWQCGAAENTAVAPSVPMYWPPSM